MYIQSDFNKNILNLNKFYYKDLQTLKYDNKES